MKSMSSSDRDSRQNWHEAFENLRQEWSNHPCRCRKSEGSDFVSARFGVAWVCQTPKKTCYAPCGWQLEFFNTPSQVEYQCQKMEQWASRPPIDECVENSVPRKARITQRTSSEECSCSKSGTNRRSSDQYGNRLGQSAVNRRNCPNDKEIDDNVDPRYCKCSGISKERGRDNRGIPEELKTANGSSNIQYNEEIDDDFDDGEARRCGCSGTSNESKRFPEELKAGSRRSSGQYDREKVQEIYVDHRNRNRRRCICSGTSNERMSKEVKVSQNTGHYEKEVPDNEDSLVCGMSKDICRGGSQMSKELNAGSRTYREDYDTGGPRPCSWRGRPKEHCRGSRRTSQELEAGERNSAQCEKERLQGIDNFDDGEVRRCRCGGRSEEHSRNSRRTSEELKAGGGGCRKSDNLDNGELRRCKCGGVSREHCRDGRSMSKELKVGCGTSGGRYEKAKLQETDDDRLCRMTKEYYRDGRRMSRDMKAGGGTCKRDKDDAYEHENCRCCKCSGISKERCGGLKVGGRNSEERSQQIEDDCEDGDLQDRKCRRRSREHRRCTRRPSKDPKAGSGISRRNGDQNDKTSDYDNGKHRHCRCRKEISEDGRRCDSQTDDKRCNRCNDQRDSQVNDGRIVQTDDRRCTQTDITKESRIIDKRYSRSSYKKDVQSNDREITDQHDKQDNVDRAEATAVVQETNVQEARVDCETTSKGNSSEPRIETLLEERSYYSKKETSSY